MATDVLRKQLQAIASNHGQMSMELDPLSESKFLGYMARVISRAMNSEACSVFILDSASNKVWLKASTDVKERGIEVPLKGSVVGEVISSGKSHISTNLEKRDGAHKAADVETGFVTREILCAPILGHDGGHALGAIEVLNRKGGGDFNEEDRLFLEESAQHLQRVVESIFLGQQAVNMAEEAIDLATRAEAKTKLWFGIGVSLLMLWGVALVVVFVKLIGR